MGQQPLPGRHPSTAFTLTDNKAASSPADRGCTWDPAKPSHRKIATPARLPSEPRLTGGGGRSTPPDAGSAPSDWTRPTALPTPRPTPGGAPPPARGTAGVESALPAAPPSPGGPSAEGGGGRLCGGRGPAQRKFRCSRPGVGVGGGKLGGAGRGGRAASVRACAEGRRAGACGARAASGSRDGRGLAREAASGTAAWKGRRRRACGSAGPAPGSRVRGRGVARGGGPGLRDCPAPGRPFLAPVFLRSREPARVLRRRSRRGPCLCRGLALRRGRRGWARSGPGARPWTLAAGERSARSAPLGECGPDGCLLSLTLRFPRRCYSVSLNLNLVLCCWVHLWSAFQ